MSSQEEWYLRNFRVTIWKVTDLVWIFIVKQKLRWGHKLVQGKIGCKGVYSEVWDRLSETFALVAKLIIVLVFLTLVANFDWPLHQLDVKNAFLNDVLKEVYMEIPQGFEHGSNTKKVCKLRKSLYGLKQSPRAWFERFTKAVDKHGYSQGQSDHTLFIKHSSDGKIAILIVYVDDTILTGDFEDEMTKLKKFLAQEFEIKDLGILKYFLGMEVSRS